MLKNTVTDSSREMLNPLIIKTISRSLFETMNTEFYGAVSHTVHSEWQQTVSAGGKNYFIFIQEENEQ